MVRNKPVISLRECAKKMVPKMVKGHIVRSAHGIHAHWFRVFTGESISGDEMLGYQVAKFKTYLLENHVWTDRQEIFCLLLQGIEEAILQVRKSWKQSTEHSQYQKVMESIDVFVSIVILPKLRKLDFQDVPRSMRSRILEILPQLNNLQILIIGPGSAGGWIPLKGKSALQLSASLSGLKHLRHFSLKKDCNLDIISALVHACGDILEVLDIENSKAVGDEAVPVIIQCTNIVDINVTGTSICDEGKARLLMGLPNLRHLPRADWLSDALGWVDYLEEMENPVFNIREFLPSQSYYFHETWQMETAAQMCPHIEKMLFIQHPDCCPSLSPLKSFTELTDLQLHGSHWITAGMDSLLENVGPRLKNLGLISVKGLDLQNMKFLLIHCTQLVGLVLNNCEFDNNNNNNTREKLTKAPLLEELVLTSSIRTELVSWLLGVTSEIRVVHLGCSTNVTDEIFTNLIKRGGLQKLEEIQIEKSTSLSLTTLNTFIEGCQNLRSVGDLAAWGGISGQELGQMRQVVHEQNLQLDLSSHQVLRRFLGMAGEDRRTMMNLMTGPLLERIRMAREAAGNLQNGQGL